MPETDRETGTNPMLDQLDCGVSASELANEARNLTTDTDLFLDKALLPQFEEGGGEAAASLAERNSFVSLQWIQPSAVGHIRVRRAF